MKITISKPSSPSTCKWDDLVVGDAFIFAEDYPDNLTSTCIRLPGNRVAVFYYDGDVGEYIDTPSAAPRKYKLMKVDVEMKVKVP